MCRTCPVALALKKATPDCHDHGASEDYLLFMLNGEYWRAKTKRKVEKHIRDFNNGRPVSPFEFTAKFTRNEEKFL